MKSQYYLLLIPLFLFTSLGYSQEENPRKLGLSASFQNSQFDLSIPVFLKKDFSVAPAVGILYIEDAGLDLSLGVILKSYFRPSKVSPFFTMRGGFFYNAPKGGNHKVDLFVGTGLGADYFMDEKFSIGIEGLLNGTFSDKRSLRFGNPGGGTVYTSAAVVGTIYF